MPPGQVSIDPSTALETASQQGPIVYLVVFAIAVAAGFRVVSMIYMEYPEHKRRMRYYDRMERGLEVLLGMVRKQSKAENAQAIRAERTNRMLERQSEFNGAVADAAGKINAKSPQFEIGEEVGRMRSAVHAVRELPDTSHMMDTIDG